MISWKYFLELNIKERIDAIMTSFRKKSTQSFKKTVSKFFTKQYLKHILLVIFITLIIGLLLSVPIARSTTVNDTTIKYTEPPVEELDTEGYSGEGQEEVPADEGQTTPEDTPVDEGQPAPEETPVEPENPVAE